MSWDEEEDTTTYRVIIDGEKQVSILPSNRKIPLGWKEADFAGKQQACLDHIKKAWADRRLVDVRR